MGGLFRAPKPVIVAPPPAPAPVTVAPTPVQAQQAAQVESQARSRRGLEGTIATSDRGVLAPLPAVARKSLLGE
ncbi:hypothetical protein [Belnapia moabensis]|uniref:hypothetical protein n=1 Tax=Belnapia moabensis TaxID=365533 RepID=UPI0005BD9AA8|nr:hypothetical protein [Belnapia moabensis]